MGDLDVLVETRASRRQGPERDKAPRSEGGVGVGGFLDDEVDELDRYDLGERERLKIHDERQGVALTLRGKERLR